MIKNGYSKILGIVFLILVFAAIVSVLYYLQVLPAQVYDFNSKPKPTKLNYSNERYQFSAMYDKSYVLDMSGTQENYFKTDGTVLSNISVPQDNFPKTNFGSASITFAVKEKGTAADCQTYLTGANATKKMTTSVSLPAGTFYTAEFKGAAAGTQYDTKLYRIFHNTVCYEASLTVGIANIGNYEPGTVAEVIEADVWNDLSAILVSMKFNDDTSGPTTDTVAKGSIEGHVSIGPNCPVEQEKPCPTPVDAYDALQIIVYSSDKAQILSKVNVNSSGNYYTELGAGVYYVTYSSVYNFYQPSMKKVTITAGKPSTQDFSIDTGIR